MAVVSKSLSKPVTQLVLTNCPAYNKSARIAQKTLFRYLRAIVAVKTCLIAKPLLSNGCCIAAPTAIVA
jgi:hypothetical protein